MSIAESHKIDRPVQFCPPCGSDNLPYAIVDLDKGTRWNKGIHRVVSKADVAVVAVFDIQVPNDGNRHLSPDCYHVCQQSRLRKPKSFIETHGKGHGSVFIVDFKPRKVSFRQRDLDLVEPDSFQVDSE